MHFLILCHTGTTVLTLSFKITVITLMRSGTLRNMERQAVGERGPSTYRYFVVKISGAPFSVLLELASLMIYVIINKSNLFIISAVS